MTRQTGQMEPRQLEHGLRTCMLRTLRSTEALKIQKVGNNVKWTAQFVR